MRARRSHLAAKLVLAVAIALAAFTAPSTTSAQAGGEHYCPSGSAWDNRLQRCV